LWLFHQVYIQNVLRDFVLENATTTSVPLRSQVNALPEAQPNSLPDVTNADLTARFQHLNGRLLYCAKTTRPDIDYATMALAQFNSNPLRKHLLAAKGILRYLAHTPNLMLQFGGTVGDVVYGMSDADWASDPADRVSVSGYAFFAYGGLISWSSQKQCTCALSSTEAEYMALTAVMQEGLWIRMYLASLGFPVPTPVNLLGDNQSAQDIANAESTSSCSKHIDIKYHFIREHIERGVFNTVWISTKDMTADIFTKPLASALHEHHVLGLGMVRR
jgi:hypothetical protein